MDDRAMSEVFGIITAAHSGQAADESDGELDLLTRAREPTLQKPPLYKVVILNDDYTPMEFVVHVLQKFFAMGQEKATQIMLAIHTSGSAVCGIYARDIADTKVQEVNQYAQENEYPLLSKAETGD